MAGLARKRLSFIRRWFGALAGAPLHVMCVTGALTLFYGPLMLWEEPFAQERSAFGGYQSVLDAAAPPTAEFQLYLPRNDLGRPSVAFVPPGAGSWQGFWVGSEPSRRLPRREALAGFLYDAHFFWHRATGLPLQYLAGFLLIGYLLSVTSEVLLGCGGTRGAQRVRGALVLATQAPSVLYAYTGALMVLGPLLVAVSVAPVFGGDSERALRVAGYFGEELAEREDPEPGPEAPALPLDDLVTAALGAEPHLVVESFSAVNYGRANGSVDVRGSVTGGTAIAMSSGRDTSVSVRTLDGRVLGVQGQRTDGATAWVARWLQGLHHTWYGGPFARTLLFALVIVGSCTFVTRQFRWLERAGQGSGRVALPSRLLARWTLGVGSGTFVAVAALFLASRSFPLSWTSRSVAEELVFPVTLTACVGWSLLASDTVRCCARQLRLAGFTLLPVPLLAARWSNAGVFGAGPRLAQVVAVDAGLAVASVALLGAARALARLTPSRSLEAIPLSPAASSPS